MLHRLYGDGWAARLAERWPGTHRVVRRAFRIQVLPPGAPPLRIAFASDLHLGPTTGQRCLDHAFEQLRAARPDVLLLGGDYIFLEMTAAKAEALSRYVASVGAPSCFAVFGNHDLWDDHDQIERALEAAGAEVLVNESRRLPPPHDGLRIVGLDDPWAGTPDAARAFADEADAACTIVLAHAAEALPWLKDHRFELMCCGHSHGGQIAAPWGPIYVPGHLSARYPAGLYHRPEGRLFVSRGLGGVEVPLRLWAPPDIAIFDLTAPTRAKAPDS